jgi:hypothetical protein
MADEQTCDHNCSCGHMQADHSSSGWCNPCGDSCANSGHYPSECLLDPPNEEGGTQGQEFDPLAHARQVLAEHQAAQAAACQAEIQAVLDRYSMRLEISTPQIAIVPNQ